MYEVESTYVGEAAIIVRRRSKNWSGAVLKLQLPVIVIYYLAYER